MSAEIERLLGETNHILSRISDSIDLEIMKDAKLLDPAQVARAILDAPVRQRAISNTEVRQVMFGETLGDVPRDPTREECAELVELLSSTTVPVENMQTLRLLVDWLYYMAQGEAE